MASKCSNLHPSQTPLQHAARGKLCNPFDPFHSPQLSTRSTCRAALALPLKREKGAMWVFSVPPPGVAVRGQHGGAALLACGTHRAHQEALQQRHRLLCKAQRPARRRGLDGRLQVTRLHGLEHPHGSKYSSHSVLSRGQKHQAIPC